MRHHITLPMIVTHLYQETIRVGFLTISCRFLVNFCIFLWFLCFRVLDVVEEEVDRGDGARRLSLNVSSAAEAGQQSGSVISTPTPVITAG